MSTLTSWFVLETDREEEDPTSSQILACTLCTVSFNNNNNRELTEHFQKLKTLYNLKKNLQCANTRNYTNQWYTSIQNIGKLTSIFIYSYDL